MECEGGEGELTELLIYDFERIPLPESIGNLRNLKRLELTSGTNFTSVPASIGNLRKLSVLNLNGNHLESLPASIGKLNLTMLYFNLMQGFVQQSIEICSTKYWQHAQFDALGTRSDWSYIPSRVLHQPGELEPIGLGWQSIGICSKGGKQHDELGNIVL